MVLLVEDEALVCMTAVNMIEEAGFEVLEAANADEAILQLEASARHRPGPRRSPKMNPTATLQATSFTGQIRRNKGEPLR